MSSATMSPLPRLRFITSRSRSRYVLTICTYRRSRTFENPYIVGRTLGEFLRLASAQHIAVLAYCFMPDHVHLLVEGVDAGSERRVFVNLSKERSGYLYRQMSGQVLWQDGYHERLLRDSDDPRKMARYLLENPVRAGIVRHPIQYPHLGSAVWSVKEILGA